MKPIILTFFVLIVLFLAGCSNPCLEEVKGKGICDGMEIGYQYNQVTEKCEINEVSGCGAISPFDSLEACQNQCENK